MKPIRNFLTLFLVLLIIFSSCLPSALAVEDESEEVTICYEEESLSEEDSLPAAVEEIPWVQPGNTDLNILSGGIMLSDGEAFYYSENGIWCDINGQSTKLSDDNGKNLNLCGSWLYYTVSDRGVMRLSLADCSAELFYECADIRQLYVMGCNLCYLQNGCVYAYDTDSQTLSALSAPENVMGFIPTQYGFIYLTGEALDYTLWVNGSSVYSHVESCYTDGDNLIVISGQTNYVSLPALFSGSSTLHSYDLHPEESETSELSPEEQQARENAFLESELYAELEALADVDREEAESEEGITASDAEDGTAVFTTAQQRAQTLGDSDGYNIARRARQLAELQWTAQSDFLAWGGGTYRADRTVTSQSGVSENYFVAGETYQGIPYSQAIVCGEHEESGYVGWDLSIAEFLTYTNDGESKQYTSHSYSGQIAPYYGMDCSGFVSWAWDLPHRCTCSGLVSYSNYIGSSINQLRLGDCLNCTYSHVVLVTDIGYDRQGNIIAVEITEATPLITKVTNYGAVLPGKSNENIYYISSLSALQRYYLNNNYGIYRRDCEDSVSYTAEESVTLKEDSWLKAPAIGLSTADDGKSLVITLSQDDGAPIHYTTDGTEATLKSPLYSEPFSVTEDTVIHAIADYKTAKAGGSFQLAYFAEVKTTSAPTLQCVSGDLESTTVSKGSVVKLVSDEDAVIYYTTDGTKPSFDSAKLGTKGITVSKAMTVKAFAVVDGCLASKTVTFSLKLGTFYKITCDCGGGGTVSPSGTVSVLEGSDKTFRFTPAEDYSVYAVKADGESVGAVKEYTFADVSGDHTLSVIFSTPLPFDDISFSSWYADEVAFAYKKGLFNGVSDTSFSPNGKMTRGMFATVLGRFAGKKSGLEDIRSGTVGFTNGASINMRAEPSSSAAVVVNIAKQGSVVLLLDTAEDASGNTWYKVSYGDKTGYIKAKYNGKSLLLFYSGRFKDISDRYYCGYVQWAQFYGLVSGVSETSFAPDSNITRQDICVILYNYLTKYCGLTLSAGDGSFTDESDISAYAVTAVHALAKAGIVNGYPDGSFAPKQTASRAEVAALFMRLNDYMNS